MRHSLLLLLCVLSVIGCRPSSDEKSYTFTDRELSKINLSEKQLHDKILGMLVGSAIGDAMGAPTEMWSREDINLQYGFVTTLDDMVREVSPEGIWSPNLPAGGTTDDTRWKVLASEYLLSQNPESLNARDFASHISTRYRTYLKEFQSIDSTDPEPYEKVSLKMGWLQEWAKISEPFIQGNLTGYADSLGKFYGGEMVCAGLLYAPSIGAFFPGNPDKAYRQAYKLTIYDLGYAKDISSLAAAMTAAGMSTKASKDSLLASLKIDPAHYFQSRLVGRTAHSILTNALRISAEAAKKDSLGNQVNPESPALQHAFTLLDQRLQDMPFHAGEIWLQTLTAMIYADFDFMGTLTFLVNYGRDNDTTAAVAGGILGAYYGFSQLPEVERQTILKVNKELLGIDLELVANRLTSHLIASQ